MAAFACWIATFKPSSWPINVSKVVATAPTCMDAATTDGLSAGLAGDDSDVADVVDGVLGLWPLLEALSGCDEGGRWPLCDDERAEPAVGSCIFLRRKSTGRP